MCVILTSIDTYVDSRVSGFNRSQLLFAHIRPKHITLQYLVFLNLLSDTLMVAW